MKLDISIEMEKGNLNSTSFSYKDYNEYGFRFNEQDYILAVKDEDFPDKNIILILHRKGQMIEDIDEYDMGWCSIRLSLCRINRYGLRKILRPML